MPTHITGNYNKKEYLAKDINKNKETNTEKFNW